MHYKIVGSLFQASIKTRGYEKKYQLPDGILFIANRIEEDIIKSRALGRLTEIKQLGLAYRVFPSANHTRFEHSLGATHYATLMFDSLMAKYKTVLGFNNHEVEYYRQKLRLNMLMHDTGHGPGGHLFERASKRAGIVFDHEKQTKNIWKSSEILKVLKKNNFNVSQKHDVMERIIEQIKDSVIDADKMDYLQRDALFCGVDVRIDAARLIDRLELSKTEGEMNLALEEGGLDAFKGFFDVRQRLYKSIYRNKWVAILERHLEEVFVRAISSRKELNKIKKYTDVDMVMMLRDFKNKDINAKALDNKRPFSFITQIHNNDDLKKKMIEEELIRVLGEKNVVVIDVKTASNQLGKYPFNITSKHSRDKPIAEFVGMFQDTEDSMYWYVYVNPDKQDQALEILKRLDI